MKKLDSFSNPVLVTGCQRSGTTILARIITQSEGMVNYWSGGDDELDAALILSGYTDHKPEGRYCFQTTYLNEGFKEYFEHGSGFKVIWVLRNPSSVVYSLLHNWERFALNELFHGCGAPLLKGKSQRRYDRFGIWMISRIERACLAYNGKVSQLSEINTNVASDDLMVVDYNDMVEHKRRILPLIYDFINLPYREQYGDTIHQNSLKKAALLSSRERRQVEELCLSVYQSAKSLVKY